MTDRFNWADADARGEVVEFEDGWASICLRDMGCLTTATLSLNEDDGYSKTMFARDLEALNRNIPFFMDGIKNGYSRLTFSVIN